MTILDFRCGLLPLLRGPPWWRIGSRCILTLPLPPIIIIITELSIRMSIWRLLILWIHFSQGTWHWSICFIKNNGSWMLRQPFYTWNRYFNTISYGAHLGKLAPITSLIHCLNCSDYMSEPSESFNNNLMESLFSLSR